jgi:tetratricopeptide (TPR) repeat protein
LIIQCYTLKCFAMIKYLYCLLIFIVTLTNANSQIDPLLQSAYEKLGKRNFDGAIAEFNQILLLTPNQTDALCGRAEAKINTGSYPEALKDIEQVIVLDNRNGKAYSLKGEVFFVQKDYTNALKFYTKSLETPTAPTQAIVGKAKSMNQMGNSKEAYKVLDDAITSQPTNAELYYARGLFNSTKEKYNKALQDFDKAAALNPNFNPFGIALNSGIAYQSIEETDKAIENFTRAVEIDPKSSTAYHTRGLAYYTLENYKEAVDDFLQSNDLNPDNSVTTFNLGMAYYKLGDKENACLYFHKSCKLGNTNSCKMIILNCNDAKR